MANYLWCTDLHLDHLRSGDNGVEDFINYVKKISPGGLLITGDISNAVSLKKHLQMLERGLQIPILYVLGNHDFWESSFEQVRKSMFELTSNSNYLKYLPTKSYVSISPESAVVGHDAWYDGANGLSTKSKFIMNDWLRIKDYRKLPTMLKAKTMKDVDMKEIVALSHEQAMLGVNHVHKGIQDAVKAKHRSIVVCIHVPPWEVAHLHEGKPGGSDAAPWFTSSVMAQLLDRAAAAYPEISFTILCGHTHGNAGVQITPNMKCYVGGAEYGDPRAQNMLSL